MDYAFSRIPICILFTGIIGCTVSTQEPGPGSTWNTPVQTSTDPPAPSPTLTPLVPASTPAPSTTPAIPTPTPAACRIDGPVTTCVVSPAFSLTIDVGTRVRTLDGYDLVQVGDEYVPFQPGVILASLRDEDDLDGVLARFGLRVREVISIYVWTRPPIIYLFEMDINGDPPELTGIRELAAASQTTGKYRFFTNSGARTYLTVLRMREAGERMGIENAALNLYVAGRSGPLPWGPIAAEAPE